MKDLDELSVEERELIEGLTITKVKVNKSDNYKILTKSWNEMSADLIAEERERIAKELEEHRLERMKNPDRMDLSHIIANDDLCAKHISDIIDFMLEHHNLPQHSVEYYRSLSDSFNELHSTWDYENEEIYSKLMLMLINELILFSERDGLTIVIPDDWEEYFETD